MNKYLIYILCILFFFSCKKEIKQLPNNNLVQYDSLINIGSELFQKEDYKNAIPNFKKAIEIDKNNPLAHYRLAVTYTSLGNENALYVNKALTIFNKISKINYNYEKINYNISICYMIKSDYKKALTYLDLAFENDSLDTDILVNRAISKLNLKDSINGCKDLFKAKALGDIDAIDLIEEFCN